MIGWWPVTFKSDHRWRKKCNINLRVCSQLFIETELLTIKGICEVPKSGLCHLSPEICDLACRFNRWCVCVRVYKEFPMFIWDPVMDPNLGITLGRMPQLVKHGSLFVWRIRVVTSLVQEWPTVYKEMSPNSGSARDILAFFSLVDYKRLGVKPW